MDFIVKRIAGDWEHSIPPTGEFQRKLSPEAFALVKSSCEDIQGEIWDYHTHLGGIGAGGTGCCVNHSAFQPFRHPVKHIKKNIFIAACGVKDESNADREFVERLVGLIRSARNEGLPWGKHFLLALDYWHEPDGSLSLEKTGMHCPNEYVWKISREFPDCFEPTISIHPYRKDAVEELDKWASLGIRMCKWLPNAQGIDPSNEKCLVFYEALKKWDISLLSHTGEEHAVDMGDVNQTFGSPLLLRSPLRAGVRVIAAHCASEGTNLDLDDPSRGSVSNFQLLLRLMSEFPDTLFCDISSMTAFRRLGEPLTTIIDREDLQDRLANGSDYPVPAINIVVQTSALVRSGYITENERVLLNEIYQINPLVFDYVTKRVLKSPVTGKKLPPKIFQAHPKIVKSTPPVIPPLDPQEQTHSQHAQSTPTHSES